MPAAIRMGGELDINCNVCHNAERIGGTDIVVEMRKLAGEGWSLGYWNGRWIMICPTCRSAAERMLEGIRATATTRR